MSLKKHPIILLVALLLLVSCSTASRLNKANRLLEEGAYAKAAAEYKGIVRKLKPGTAEQAWLNYAESYRRLADYRNEEMACAGLLRAEKKPAQPEVYLRYGKALMANEKYEDAQKQFLRYKELQPNDPRADTALSNLEWVQASSKAPAEYKVTAVSALNLSRSNNYAPVYGADDYETILFTSTRKADNQTGKTYDVTGEVYADLYFSRLSRAGKWDRPRNMGEEINNKYEDGAAVFNSDYSILYYTRCQKVKREKSGCKIYTIRRNGDQWQEAQALPIVPDSITAAHPAIAGDELTLYFASDLSGGMGQMDIWKVTRASAGDDWGEPVNMGSQINTPGNDLFPFARANGELYIASNGHAGFGGLDIFKATPDSLGGWLVQNMGRPVNSPADDFSIILEQENERGYFASRRRERGLPAGDKIFSFTRDVKPVEYFFEGMAINAATGNPLENADIRLVSSGGGTLRKRTEADGAFSFRVNAGLEYLALASRNGYLNGKLRFSTVGWENGQTHKDTFALTSTDRPIEIPNIFFDFGQATLSDASRASLDSLVGIMKDNPAIVVELRAHTDNRGSNEANMDLSQRRAQSVVDYLIQNGIDEMRLEAVGFGESEPKTVDAAIAGQHPFLPVGQKLTEKFIQALSSEREQEICHQFNRRTELQVIRNDYVAE